jgi:hypothetical protein
VTQQEYADAARSAVESAMRELLEELKGLEQTTHATYFIKDNDIGPVLFSMGEAYSRPSAYTVSCLVQAVEAFLKARPAPAEMPT